jgi:hypothetical protein
MYSTASRMVRRVPPSLVGRGSLDFGRGTQDATTWCINNAGRGRVESDSPPKKTKTYFAFRIDVWDCSGDNLTEQLAGVEDYAMAVAAYWAAIQSRPQDKITLRQGAAGCLSISVEPRATRPEIAPLSVNSAALGKSRTATLRVELITLKLHAYHAVLTEGSLRPVGRLVGLCAHSPEIERVEPGSQTVIQAPKRGAESCATSPVSRVKQPCRRNLVTAEFDRCCRKSRRQATGAQQSTQGRWLLESILRVRRSS